MLRSEQFYCPAAAWKKLLAMIWKLSRYIIAHEVLHISYRRQDGAERAHEIKPVAIMFSEYYFYLMAYMANGHKDFLTIFRIDRIEDFASTGAQFRMPYTDKFSDGEFRKRVQFMYAGDLHTVQFEYTAVPPSRPSSTVFPRRRFSQRKTVSTVVQLKFMRRGLICGCAVKERWCISYDR